MHLTPIMRRISFLALIWVVLHLTSPDAHAQRVAKYGADFLAGGVGARALAMGGAHIAVSDDVYSGFWNPAGLVGVTSKEASYMHAERFAGVVSFDYAAYAMPFSERSILAVSLIRSGVNDIKNTLDAWDAERNQPKPDPGSSVTTFSAADWALMISYGKRIGSGFSVGATSKIIRRNIGDFASAWGYSMDVGVRWQTGSWLLGANLQDVTTMLQSWSVNSGSLINLRDVFGDDLPEGGTEIVLPVLRLGTARSMNVGTGTLLVSLDADLAFDGYTTNSISFGDTSVHPRLGVEYAYADVVFLRGGINRVLVLKDDGLDLTPSLGAGFKLGAAEVDYGFGDFAGLVSDLGFSHRISVKYRFDKASQ